MSKREPRSWVVPGEKKESGNFFVEAESLDQARECVEMGMYYTFIPDSVQIIEVTGNPKENV